MSESAPEKEVRVIEWIEPGYEGSFTQYTILPIREPEQVYGDLWIVQIATQDNMARALDSGRPERIYGTLDGLRGMVGRLIESRTSDGGAREIVAEAKTHG